MNALDDAIATLEQLRADRKAQHGLEPNDPTSTYFRILEIHSGKDRDGTDIWTEVFRHSNKARVSDYAALHHAGRLVRITGVQREFPGATSGRITGEFTTYVPDGYDGIMKRFEWRL